MANTNITKKAIQSAFLELLNEKPLSKITVKDISDRCGINRNTFYYHYQDILDLLEEISNDQVDEVVKQYPKISSLDDCVNAIMEFGHKNKRTVMNIFNSIDNGAYVASVWRVCDHVVNTYADTVFPDAPISDYDRKLFKQFYKCACFGLVIDWISTGMNDEYATGVRRMCTLKKNIVELTIQNCIESYNQDINDSEPL